MHTRRRFLAAAGALAVAGPALATGPVMTVEKSPTCGCCTAWVDHMRAAGFDVRTRDVDQEALWRTKAMAGVTPETASCHTAMIDGYVVEGHVPAEDVRRLLAERPRALGLAVPGMPIGSPGMEMGAREDAYDVLLLNAGGGTEVFSRR
jgi:hypothetical protein